MKWEQAYQNEYKSFDFSKMSEEEVSEWKYQRYMEDYLRCVKSVDDNVGRILKFLDEDNKTLLKQEMAFQVNLAQTSQYASLPKGAIHADLFRDNVMFEGEQLTGFFDFYFAGTDSWLFDVAVCLNDWCIDLESGTFDPKRMQAFLKAYQLERPFTTQERRLLHPLLRAAALRFWVSRLWDFHLPRQANLLKAHDPKHFERILKLRAQSPLSDTPF